MKKTIMKVTLVAALGLFASYNVYSSQKSVELSDMALANVEALAGFIEEAPEWCPGGCSDIGWGMNKILECDCGYDIVSCCNRWGC